MLDEDHLLAELLSVSSWTEAVQFVTNNTQLLSEESRSRIESMIEDLAGRALVADPDTREELNYLAKFYRYGLNIINIVPVFVLTDAREPSRSILLDIVARPGDLESIFQSLGTEDLDLALSQLYSHYKDDDKLNNDLVNDVVASALGIIHTLPKSGLTDAIRRFPLNIRIPPDWLPLSLVGPFMIASAPLTDVQQRSLDDLKSRRQCLLLVVEDESFEFFEPDLRWALLNNLGVVFFREFEATGDISMLESSVNALRNGMSRAGGSFSGVSLLLRNNLAAACEKLFIATGDDEYLEFGISTASVPQEIDSLDASERFAFLSLAGILAGLLRNKFRVHGDRNALAGALSTLREVRLLADRYGVNEIIPYVDHNYGLALIASYLHMGAVSDLLEAVSAHRRAVAETPEGHLSYCNRVRSFGYAVVLQYHMNDDEDELSRVLRLMEDCTDRLRPPPGDLQGLKNNIAAAYLARSLANRSEVAAGRAVEEFRTVVRMDRESDIRYADHLSNLGGALLSLHSITQSPKHLDECLSVLESARRAGGAETGLLESKLAAAYMRRYAINAQEEDHLSAIGHYRNVSNSRANAGAVVSLVEWGRSAAQNRRWPEAAEAFFYVKRILRRLYLIQRSALDARRILEQLPPFLADEMAFVFAMVGDQSSVLECLEYDRCLWAAAQLDVPTQSIEQLKLLDNDLYRRYMSLSSLAYRASASWDEPPDGNVGRLARFDSAPLGELAEVVEEIRTIPELAEFLSLPDLSTVKEFVERRGPVAYISGCSWGGLLLTLSPEGEEIHILTSFDANDYQETTRRFYDAEAARATDPEIFATALHSLGKWLWSNGGELLVERLSRGARCTMITSGLFANLPIHAGCSDITEGDCRYVGDCVTISYAPSIQMLAGLPHDRGQLRGTVEPASKSVRLLTVHNPWPTSAGSLPWANEEVTSICSRYDGATQLTRASASRRRVLEEIESAEVVHLACHGVLRKPFVESGLVLAGDEILTVRDLLEVRGWSHVGLVVLSACDSGFALDLIDEGLALPAAFIRAGVRGVISSLWPISDRVAALLMAELHLLLRIEQLAPSEALRLAQIRVRTHHAEALRDSALGDAFEAADWAAFFYTGVS